MKLKIIKRESKEVETNLDLPVFLYFQDELGYDELVYITENKKTTVKYSRNNVIISVETNFIIEDLDFETCQTTEEHFDESLSDAIKYLMKSIS